MIMEHELKEYDLSNENVHLVFIFIYLALNISSIQHMKIAQIKLYRELTRDFYNKQKHLKDTKELIEALGREKWIHVHKTDSRLQYTQNYQLKGFQFIEEYKKVYYSTYKKLLPSLAKITLKSVGTKNYEHIPQGGHELLYDLLNSNIKDILNNEQNYEERTK